MVGLSAWNAENAANAERAAREQYYRDAPARELAALVQPHHNAVVAIVRERRRQVDMEGWTPAHDDAEHSGGEMARAAAAYALHAGWADHPRATGWPDLPPKCWPWDDDWWKPADPRRCLIKAAALIVAEIERLDRAAIARAAAEKGAGQ